MISIPSPWTGRTIRGSWIRSDWSGRTAAQRRGAPHHVNEGSVRHAGVLVDVENRRQSIAAPTMGLDPSRRAVGSLGLLPLAQRKYMLGLGELPLRLGLLRASPFWTTCWSQLAQSPCVGHGAIDQSCKHRPDLGGMGSRHLRLKEGRPVDGRETFGDIADWTLHATVTDHLADLLRQLAAAHMVVGGVLRHVLAPGPARSAPGSMPPSCASVLSQWRNRCVVTWIVGTVRLGEAEPLENVLSPLIGADEVRDHLVDDKSHGAFDHGPSAVERSCRAQETDGPPAPSATAAATGAFPEESQRRHRPCASASCSRRRP